MRKSKLILISIIFQIKLGYSQINSLSSINHKGNYYIVQTAGIISDVWYKEKNNFFSLKYENPSCGDFLIQSRKLATKSTQSYLLTLNGVIIDKKKINFDSEGFSRFSNRLIPQGVYIFQINYQGKLYSSKLLIQCDQ